MKLTENTDNYKMKTIKRVIAWLLSKLWSRKEVLGKNGITNIVDRKFNKIKTVKVKNPNLTMFTFNLETRRVEKVPIIIGTDGNKRGFCNPNYPSVWAINIKNAKRKFANHGYVEL